jgi:glycosyltransferase involved in cell wall biosynthesis
MIPPLIPLKISGISAVFPAFNDGGTIPSMILTALMALRQVTDDYEIIVVDDGSSDTTRSLLDEMVTRYPELMVIHHATNMGYGSALRTGFGAATKDWIFYTDGDGQYNPIELIDLVAAVNEKVDVVNGYKISRSDPLVMYHFIVKWVFGFHLKDVDCDFRLFRRKILESVHLESTTGTLPLELVKKFQDAGFLFVEVPVHHYYRQYGKSQFFNLRRLFRTGVQLMQLWRKLVWKKRLNWSAK